MFDDWPTLSEVVERTGISERTLHRKIKDGEIRREYRRILGRKPITVIDPEQAKTLEQTILHPIPGEPSPTIPTNSDALALLAQLRDALVVIADHVKALPAPENPEPMYLPIKTAARISGLSKPFLKRGAEEGRIPALKVGRSWHFRRTDLERLGPAKN